MVNQVNNKNCNNQYKTPHLIKKLVSIKFDLKKF